MNFFEWLFPAQCFSCHKWDSHLCHDCQSLLIITQHQRCIVCQQPSLYGFTHPKCYTVNKPERLISVFPYSNPLITKMINNGKLGLSKIVFSELARVATTKIVIRNQSFQKFTLTPIPLSRAKKRFRGFNQSELIAKVFAKQFNIPIDNLLKKTKTTKQQKSLNKEGRAKNILSAFSLKSLESLPSHILLIDDVTTSGATFLEATKTLKKAGIKTVWCIAIAQD